MRKIKKYTYKDWIVLDVIIKNSINIFECQYKENKNRLKRKGLLLLPNKLIEKVHDPCNVKEHYALFLRKKNRKSVTQSKTSHKLSKNIRQA